MSSERILVDLAVIFVAGKLAGAAFERLRQPAVIGELIAGVLLGPHLLAVIGSSPTHRVFQQLGAIVLLFAVGLDTPLDELKTLGGRSLAVSVSGMVLPFVGGAAFILAAGGSAEKAVFVGAALVSTSVGVTARVLADLGLTRAPESRVIIGAAVVDDVLGLLVLAVVAQSAAGSISVGSIALVGSLAVGFVVLAGSLGPRLVARATPVLDRIGNEGVFAVALGLCLLLSAAAGALQLAAIIGAFLAGLAFAETRDRYELEVRLRPVYSLLVPFFFVITGSLVDLHVFSDPHVIFVGLGVLAVAVVGKFVGCAAAAAPMGRRSAAIVATGMVPRGEVGILVATLGLAHGVIGPALYGIVVAMTAITTIGVPPVLARLFAAQDRG
jgi:Kef-type K+ transport system membrane component KefB